MDPSPRVHTELSLFSTLTRVIVEVLDDCGQRKQMAGRRQAEGHVNR